MVSEPNLDPQTRTRSPAPERTVSQPPPTALSKPDERQMETASPAEAEDVAAPQTDPNVADERGSEQQSAAGERQGERREQEKVEEERQRDEEAAAEEQAEEAEVADVVEEADVNVELEEEQPTERDVDDSVLLSEKERQNEEVNEKDNCSASSISSTSSTLEREEREEKLSSDLEAGTTNAYFTVIS